MWRRMASSICNVSLENVDSNGTLTDNDIIRNCWAVVKANANGTLQHHGKVFNCSNIRVGETKKQIFGCKCKPRVGEQATNLAAERSCKVCPSLVLCGREKNPATSRVVVAKVFQCRAAMQQCERHKPSGGTATRLCAGSTGAPKYPRSTKSSALAAC